jgi:hypothetical protein
MHAAEARRVSSFVHNDSLTLLLMCGVIVTPIVVFSPLACLWATDLPRPFARHRLPGGHRRGGPERLMSAAVQRWMRPMQFLMTGARAGARAVLAVTEPALATP